MEILQTTRLSLREFRDDDHDGAFIVELLNSPGWIQYIGDRGVRTVVYAREYLRNGPISNYQKLGFGFWGVEELATGALVGMCGFTKRETLEHADIGFAFLPEFAGQGFAYEAAQACLRYASSTLRLHEIMAIVLPDNVRSVRLLEKLGGTFQQSIVMPPKNEVLSVFHFDQA